jgi:hypothetical protein
MNFLRVPATRRDLMVGAGAMTVLIILVIFSATVALIRLHEQQEVYRQRLADAREKIRNLDLDLTAQTEKVQEVEVIVREVTEQIEVERQQAAEVVTRTVRQAPERVRTIVQRLGAPVLDRTSSPSLPRPSLPVRTPRPERTPIQRPDRPTRPSLPDLLPDRPSLPPRSTPAPTPAPAPPAPTPAPAPPAVEPPRPGNKPDHAPCPPRNPNCP